MKQPDKKPRVLVREQKVIDSNLYVTFDSDHDSCEYAEAVKVTLTRIRKLAKHNREAVEITKLKLDAVRNHDRSKGNLARYKVGERVGSIIIGIY